MLCPPSDAKQCLKAMVILALPLLKAREIATQPTNHRVAPWHYKPSHRRIDPNTGKWKLIKSNRYQDEDGKYWDFPPPNYPVQKYIDNEIDPHVVRGGVDDSLPLWFADLVSSQELALSQTSQDTHTTRPLVDDMPSITPSKRARSAKKRKTRVQTEEELNATKEELRLIQAKYANAMGIIEEQRAIIESKDKELEIISNKLNAALAKNSSLKRTTATMQSKAKISHTMTT
jgi:hypothetical protein